MPYVIYDSGLVVTVGNFPIGMSSVLVPDNDPDLLYYYLYPQVVANIQFSLRTALSTVVNGADIFSVNGELYNLLINQINVANITASPNVTLTLANGSTIVYTTVNANILLGDIAVYLTAVYVNYNALQAAISSALTYAALIAIDPPSGWPSNIL